MMRASFHVSFHDLPPEVGAALATRKTIRPLAKPEGFPILVGIVRQRYESAAHFKEEDSMTRNTTAVALVLGSAISLGMAASASAQGQRADPDFNTKVARPAYADGPRHPRVLFDEAHHNFHTASGRYKPFAELITSDGYQVIPNTEKFTRERSCRRATSWSSPTRWGPRGWASPRRRIRRSPTPSATPSATGSRTAAALLFITDHAPMGSAAQCLAKRFGVDMSTGAVADPKNSEGGETLPGLQPAEPPAGRPPDHPGPR